MSWMDRLFQRQEDAKSEDKELSRLRLEHEKVTAELTQRTNALTEQIEVRERKVEQIEHLNDPEVKRQRAEEQAFFDARSDSGMVLYALNEIVRDWTARHGKSKLVRGGPEHQYFTNQVIRNKEGLLLNLFPGSLKRRLQEIESNEKQNKQAEREMLRIRDEAKREKPEVEDGPGIDLDE